MKIKKITPQIFLFEARNQKELTLTFYRVQEFYESPLKELKSKHFSVYEFIKAQMKDNGHLDYFHTWVGFNFPDYVLTDWARIKTQSLGKEEYYLIDQIEKIAPKDKPYYILGSVQGAKNVVDHEIAHALYHVNLDYRTVMDVLIDKLIAKDKDLYKKICKCILDEYSKDVLHDELQAYLSTSSRGYLNGKRFGLELDDASYKRLTRNFRKIFKEFRPK